MTKQTNDIGTVLIFLNSNNNLSCVVSYNFLFLGSHRLQESFMWELTPQTENVAWISPNCKNSNRHDLRSINGTGVHVDWRWELFMRTYTTLYENVAWISPKGEECIQSPAVTIANSIRRGLRVWWEASMRTCGTRECQQAASRNKQVETIWYTSINEIAMETLETRVQGVQAQHANNPDSLRFSKSDSSENERSALALVRIVYSCKFHTHHFIFFVLERQR